MLENDAVIEEQELVDQILEENLDEVNNDTDSAAISTIVIDQSKAIKLTDSAYSEAVHKNHQAEAQNIIEIGKAYCFESAMAMQKYVIQNCKAENKLAEPAKCEEYNKMADLAIKNCATIFPMETNYDNVLNVKLMESISEAVIISDAGDILYIGAGEAVTNQQHYTPKIEAPEVNAIIKQGSLMLAGEDVLLTSADLVVNN